MIFDKHINSENLEVEQQIMTVSNWTTMRASKKSAQIKESRREERGAE